MHRSNLSNPSTMNPSLPAGGGFYQADASSKHLHRRGCCRSSCKLLFLTLLATLFTIIIFLVVAWLLLQPESPNFNMETATLAYYNPISTSNYSDWRPSTTPKQYENFMVMTRFSIRNPNKKIDVYYELRELVSNNSGGWWEVKSIKDLPPSAIHQPTKNTTMLEVAYDSELPGVKIVDDRKTEEELGRVYIKLSGRIRFKVWLVKTPNFSLKIKCDLLVPVEIDGRKTTSAVFNPTSCNLQIYF